jgi:2-haloacid dehalogenase
VGRHGGLLLFDLNGTLTDPKAIGGAWQTPELGVAVLAAAVQSAMVDAILGTSRKFTDHIEAALNDEVARRGLDPARIDEALQAVGALPAYPDAAPGLEALANGGHRLGVLTNSGADAGRRTLEANGLAGRFERILGVDGVGSFKPHPAVYRYALEELGCDPATVTFVSAHAWDLAGAAHAGMRTAFVIRDEPWASAYPRPDIEAADLPGIAVALSG